MATAGFRVVGDAGNVLVSQDYKNMQMVESGTVSPPSNGSGASFSSFARSGLTAPILFVAGPRLATGYACAQSNGSTTFLIFANGSSSAAVSYYIFDTAAAANPHGGLQVRDASGSVVFDSGAKALRVVDQRSISAGNASSSLAYTPSRSYAVAHVAFGIREVWSQDQNRDFIGTTAGSGGIATALFKYGSAVPNATNYRNAVILVADVTGY